MKELKKRHLDTIIKKSKFFVKKKIYFENDADRKVYDKLGLRYEIFQILATLLFFIIYLKTLKLAVDIIPVQIQMIFSVILLILWIYLKTLAAKRLFYYFYKDYKVSESLYAVLEDAEN